VVLPKNDDVKVGDQIEMLLNDALLLSKTIEQVDADKEYIDIPLNVTNLGEDGRKILTLRMIDRAGNKGPFGNKITFNLKRKAPVASVSLELMDLPPLSGFMNRDQSSRLKGVKVVLLPGSNEFVPGDQVELLLNGFPFSIPKVKSLSKEEIESKRIQFSLSGADLDADGDKNITARFIDRAGNVGLAYGEFLFKLVRKMPDAPGLIEFGTNHLADGWLNAAELRKTTNIRIELSRLRNVAAESGRIEAWLNGEMLGLSKQMTLNADDLSRGYYDMVLQGAEWGADGPKELKVRLIDKAGNVGKFSDALNFAVSGLVPAMPTLVEKDNSFTADGYVNANEISKGLSIEVVLPDVAKESIQVGDTIELLLNSSSFESHKSKLVDINAQRTGRVEFSLNASELRNDGLKSVTAQVISQSGNKGPKSKPITFEFDTEPPGAALLSQTATLDLVDGWLNAQEAQKKQTIRVHLPNMMGATKIQEADRVDLLINGLSYAQSKNVSSLDLTRGFVEFVVDGKDFGFDGEKIITAVITDKAGNVSADRSSIRFTRVTSVPDKPMVKEWGSSDLVDGWMNLAEATTPKTIRVVMGENELSYADRVELLLNGVPFAIEKSKRIEATDVINQYVDFLVSRKDWGIDGDKTLSARVVDHAGNYGVVSDAIRFKLKTSLVNQKK
jgi:hypothetical protein